MRKLSGIFAAVLLLLTACAPAAVPTEETTPETQGEELVSTLSMPVSYTHLTLPTSQQV